MGPILWFDIPLVFLGVVALILAVRGWRRCRSRQALGTTGMFFLGVGSLAAVVIDVGLSERDKQFRQFLVENAGIVRVGAPAPDFSLPCLDDGKPVRLGAFRGRKPVCLILSSFTCDIFCAQLVHLRRLHHRHGDRVEFLFVYIRDAYHHLPTHLRDFGKAPDIAKRQQLVREGMERHRLSFTCMLDREDAQVERLYGAFPKRLFLIDGDGRIAWDSGNVPSDPIPWDELDQWMQEQGRTAERRAAGGRRKEFRSSADG